MRSSAKLLTTGAVAKLCGFSSSAVLRWIRSGKLPAYSSPGGQYRVDPHELLECLKTNGMRIPAELADSGPRRILLIDADWDLREAATSLLAGCWPDSDVAAVGGVAGCMKMAELKPHLVILDVLVSDIDCVELCSWLKGAEVFEETKVLLVAADDEDDRLWAALAAGADGWVRKPLEAGQFLARIAELLDIPLPQHASA